MAQVSGSHAKSALPPNGFMLTLLRSPEPMVSTALRIKPFGPFQVWDCGFRLVLSQKIKAQEKIGHIEPGIFSKSSLKVLVSGLVLTKELVHQTEVRPRLGKLRPQFQNLLTARCGGPVTVACLRGLSASIKTLHTSVRL